MTPTHTPLTHFERYMVKHEDKIKKALKDLQEGRTIVECMERIRADAHRRGIGDTVPVRGEKRFRDSTEGELYFMDWYEAYTYSQLLRTKSQAPFLAWAEPHLLESDLALLRTPGIERALDEFGITGKELGENLAEERKVRITTMWHMAQHSLERRVFLVQSGLAYQLWHTELRGLTTDDLHAPFSTILIFCPDAPFRVPVKNFGEETPGWPESIYLSEVVHDGMRRWEVTVNLIPEGTDIWQREDHAVRQYFAFDLTPGVTLDEVFELARPMIGKISSEDYWKPVLNWLINVALYATSSDARRSLETPANEDYARLTSRIDKLGKGPKKERLKEERRKLDPRRRIYLGNGIALPKVDPTNPRGPLNVQVKVKGHGRWQPYGPGRKERKHIFIEPFWRGPKDAPKVVGGIHVMGRSEKEES